MKLPHAERDRIGFRKTGFQKENKENERQKESDIKNWKKKDVKRKDTCIHHMLLLIYISLFEDFTYLTFFMRLYAENKMTIMYILSH